MTRPARLLLFLCLPMVFLPDSLPAAGVTAADTSIGAMTSCRITIQSTPESALVVIDGRRAGSTPLTVDSLRPGSHFVMIQPPDLESWLNEPVSDTIQIDGGERRILRYDLRAHHLIASTPFGAEVVLGDSVIGTTPYVTETGMAGHSLILRKPGFEPATVQLAATQQLILEVPLKRVWQNEGPGESYLREEDGRGSGTTARYLSGTATVVFGVAAAYLKIKADNRYQQFLDTNDGKLLTQTHRLDTAAGIAIAATQISLGLFTYFIFSK